MNEDYKKLTLNAELVCTEAYLAVGQLADLAGVFDAPEVERLLDNLLAISERRAAPHETILPFYPKAQR